MENRNFNIVKCCITQVNPMNHFVAWPMVLDQMKIGWTAVEFLSVYYMKCLADMASWSDIVIKALKGNCIFIWSVTQWIYNMFTDLKSKYYLFLCFKPIHACCTEGYEGMCFIFFKE